MDLPSILKIFNLVNLNDRNVCIGFSMLTYFSIAHSVIGGLAIALIRVLFIVVSKCNFSAQGPACQLGTLHLGDALEAVGTKKAYSSSNP